MNRKILGIAVVGGGLLWYMSSQSSALPSDTTPASTDTTTTTTTPTTGGGDDDTTGDDDSTTETTETDEGSDDASTVDPTDCSKYRASHHGREKVWMSSTKSKSFIDDIIGSPLHTSYSLLRPRGIKMDDFTTGQEQYFVNQEIDWSLKLSVKNTSKDQCGKTWAQTHKNCWLPPGKDGGAYGNDCCLRWTVTWTNPQGETYVDDSGSITRPDTKPKDGGPVWSTLNGKFRIPNVESSIGTWDVAIKYWWDGDAHGSKPSVSWEGQVFSVVPESCGQETSAAETFKADFTRPIFAPRLTQQSFMEF